MFSVKLHKICVRFDGKLFIEHEKTYNQKKSMTVGSLKM